MRTSGVFVSASRLRDASRARFIFPALRALLLAHPLLHSGMSYAICRETRLSVASFQCADLNRGIIHVEAATIDMNNFKWSMRKSCYRSYPHQSVVEKLFAEEFDRTSCVECCHHSSSRLRPSASTTHYAALPREEIDQPALKSLSCNAQSFQLSSCVVSLSQLPRKPAIS